MLYPVNTRIQRLWAFTKGGVPGRRMTHLRRLLGLLVVLAFAGGLSVAVVLRVGLGTRYLKAMPLLVWLGLVWAVGYGMGAIALQYAAYASGGLFVLHKLSAGIRLVFLRPPDSQATGRPWWQWPLQRVFKQLHPYHWLLLKYTIDPALVIGTGWLISGAPSSSTYYLLGEYLMLTGGCLLISDWLFADVLRNRLLNAFDAKHHSQEVTTSLPNESNPLRTDGHLIS